MTWDEILVAFGGLAGLAGGIGIFAKVVAEKTAEAGLKRFEHSLKLAEQNHDASLKRSEAEYGSSLRRVEESHKASIAFVSTLDQELRTQRTKAYAVLWTTTGKLPEWPRNEKLQYEELQMLSEHMRDWYFQTGGIYLSQSARKVYGAAQETIHKVIGTRKTGFVETADYDLIREACSTLRTELTRDLLSRREAPSLVTQDAL